jgi:hypothetical protein
MVSQSLSQNDELRAPVRNAVRRLLSRAARSWHREAAPPQPVRILFLDDDPARAENFLGRHPEAVWVQTVEECLEQMQSVWEQIHLDHDLGGKRYVDLNAPDCGMEVIRWLCKEPREHLKKTRFLVHTHNSVAGLMMVLQMRVSGYSAEFRPFGFDLAEILAHNEKRDSSASGLRARWSQFWQKVARPPGSARRTTDEMNPESDDIDGHPAAREARNP